MRKMYWFMLMALFSIGCWNTPEDDDDDDWGEGAGWRNDTGNGAHHSDPFGDGESDGSGDQTEPIDECTSPPLIDHDEIDSAQPSNADVQIIAYVYPANGCEAEITTVDLYFRQETATDWNRVTMTPGLEPDEWRGLISAYSLSSAKIYYYIRAEDTQGQETVEPEDADTALLKAYYFGVSTS